MSRKGDGRGLASIEEYIDITFQVTGRIYTKEKRKTNYSSQQQHMNRNNLRKKGNNDKKNLQNKNMWYIQ